MDRRVVGLVSVALLVPVLLSAQKQARVIFVNVADRTGSPVLNLTPPDFDVSVGGVKQTVTRATFGAPMRIVLLVDSSGAISQEIPAVRLGLKAFLDAVPPEPEIALISIAGQLGVRQAPTTDRTRLHAVVDRFSSEGGGNAFLDVLLEADKRFLKNAPERWPVFVILTTDNGEMRGAPNIEMFNAMVTDFRVRGGSAHAMVIRGKSTGLVSDLTLNLVQNTGGLYDAIAISNALPDKMKALATRLAAEGQAMANRYVVEYAGDAKSTQPVDVKIAREGVTLQLSARRPF